MAIVGAGGTAMHHAPANSGGMDDHASCDGFIAAFDLPYTNPVGITTPATPAPHLVVNPLQVDGHGKYTSLARATGR